MRVQVIYFQLVRRLTGRDGETFDVPEGALLEELKGAVIGRYAQLGPVAGSLLFAVNEEHAGPEQRLSEGDTVAIMPPFSGG